MDDIQACRECGFRHPPTPPGQCPMAQDKTIQTTIDQLKNEKVIKYMQAIRIKLTEKLQSQSDEEQEILVKAVYQLLEQF